MKINDAVLVKPVTGHRAVVSVVDSNVSLGRLEQSDLADACDLASLLLLDSPWSVQVLYTSESPDIRYTSSRSAPSTDPMASTSTDTYFLGVAVDMSSDTRRGSFSDGEDELAFVVL